MSDEPRPAPNYSFALATILVAIATGFLLRLTIALYAHWIGGAALLRWLETSALGLAILAALIQVALFAVVWVRSSHVPLLRAGILADARTRKSRWVSSLLLILGLGPFANLCAMGVAKLTGSSLASMEKIALLIRRASPAELTLLAVVLTVFPAVVEESLFRGLVYRSLRGTRVWVAIVLQAVAFGVFHLDVAQGIATMILGLGFGFIAMTTGSLVGSMVAHAGYNLTVLLSQRFLATDTASPHWLGLELTIGAVVAAYCARSLSQHGMPLR